MPQAEASQCTKRLSQEKPAEPARTQHAQVGGLLCDNEALMMAKAMTTVLQQPGAAH